MQEIRFRATEDRIQLELVARQRAVEMLGSFGQSCSKCGGGCRVLSSPYDGSSECIYCFAKRRFAELTSEESLNVRDFKQEETTAEAEQKPYIKVNNIKFDLEDFCRL